MATKEELEIAIKVVKEVSGDPSVGVIKDLIDSLSAPTKEAKSFTPVTETRVAEVKETR